MYSVAINQHHWDGGCRGAFGGSWAWPSRLGKLPGLRPPAPFPGQVPSLTPSPVHPINPLSSIQKMPPAFPADTPPVSLGALNSIKEETEAQRGLACPRHSKTQQDSGLLAQRLLALPSWWGDPAPGRRQGTLMSPGALSWLLCGCSHSFPGPQRSTFLARDS